MMHTMSMPMPVGATTATSNESDEYTTEELLKLLAMCDPTEKENQLIDEIECMCARADAEARALSPTRELELDNCMHILRETTIEHQSNETETNDFQDTTSTGSTISTPTVEARAAEEDATIVVQAVKTTEQDLKESVLTIVVNEDGTQTVHESMNIDKLPMPTIDADGNVTFSTKTVRASKPVSPINKKSKSPKRGSSPTSRIVVGVKPPIASLASTQGVVTQRGHVYTAEQIDWFLEKLNGMIGTAFRVPYSFETEFNNLFKNGQNGYTYRSIRSKLARMADFEGDQ